VAIRRCTAVRPAPSHQPACIRPSGQMTDEATGPRVFCTIGRTSSQQQQQPAGILQQSSQPLGLMFCRTQYSCTALLVQPFVQAGRLWEHATTQPCSPAENQCRSELTSCLKTENRAGEAHFFPSALSMATRIMAAWRDLPPHMAAPPDGGHSVTMGHHVGRQAR
jgi:hypothetical protein